MTNNGGTITETSWTDAVFLDRSITIGETLPKSASHLVAEEQHIGALPNGGSYTIQTVFRIPANWEGSLYVFLLFDSGESISDLSGSKIVSNVSDVVMVTALEFPDLSLTFNQENITLSSGEPFDLSYSLTNNGSGPTLFPWFDTIYLSEDAIIDPFDLKLKTVIHHDILNPGESKAVMETVDIPFDITTTSLYFIVQVSSSLSVDLSTCCSFVAPLNVCLQIPTPNMNQGGNKYYIQKNVSGKSGIPQFPCDGDL